MLNAVLLFSAIEPALSNSHCADLPGHAQRRKPGLELYFNLPKDRSSTFELQTELTRDVGKISHFYTGDLEVTLAKA